uniref:Uncharacterized protein n=1 Tax=Romanomermis culicivorax TaxID=13658 RepID=A0A915K9K9_ROMCU
MTKIPESVDEELKSPQFISKETRGPDLAADERFSKSRILVTLIHLPTRLKIMKNKIEGYQKTAASKITNSSLKRVYYSIIIVNNHCYG